MTSFVPRVVQAIVSFSANAMNVASRIQKVIRSRGSKNSLGLYEAVDESVTTDGRVAITEVAEAGCSTMKF